MQLWDIRYRGVMDLYMALHAGFPSSKLAGVCTLIILNDLVTFVSVCFFFMMYFSIFKTLRSL